MDVLSAVIKNERLLPPKAILLKCRMIIAYYAELVKGCKRQ